MIIKAKYSGQCTICESKISEGELIVWEKGQKPLHYRCVTSVRMENIAREILDGKNFLTITKVVGNCLEREYYKPVIKKEFIHQWDYSSIYQVLEQLRQPKPNLLTLWLSPLCEEGENISFQDIEKLEKINSVNDYNL